jgi:hypothetical protein
LSAADLARGGLPGACGRATATTVAGDPRKKLSAIDAIVEGS